MKVIRFVTLSLPAAALRTIIAKAPATLPEFGRAPSDIRYRGMNELVVDKPLGPGGMRELHWHPNTDEWQYYIQGQARMGVFGGLRR